MSKKYKPTGWLSASRVRAKASSIVSALDNVYLNRKRNDPRPGANDLASVEWVVNNQVKWLRTYLKDFKAEIHKNKIPPA